MKAIPQEDLFDDLGVDGIILKLSSISGMGHGLDCSGSG
jgi:hypothetical protein